MKLNELLKYDSIVIQCHDNPDADALASGYALLRFFESCDKAVRFIYRGRNQISKSNLLIMMKELGVPVTFEPDFNEKPDLLVTVDCQYGQRNVTATEAETIAVIDHHQVSGELPELSEVRSNIGSCSTIVWDMIRDEGKEYLIDSDRMLSTALYYGLYTDTSKLSEMSHPLDRDMADTLFVNKSVITEMSNSNITLSELKITGLAILHNEYDPINRTMIIQAEPCDPNILGVISDFAMETAEVDVCLAFYASENEVKFSVRSCIKEVHADELAEFVAEDYGGGGGHLFKAGGVLWPDRLMQLSDEDISAVSRYYFIQRIQDYFDKYDVIYAKTINIDTEGLPIFEKQPQVLGNVKLTDIFPVDTVVDIRTLEGDVTIKVEDDIYMMIGLEGEVYPIRKEKLERSYKLTNEPYKRSFEYDPTIKNIATGERRNILKYARGVISSGGVRVYAFMLDRHVKLFTAWDDEKYYSGNPGDYIAIREDDHHDLYIIRRRLFPKLYKEVET